MLDLLKTICALRGASGDESEVRSFIFEYAMQYADSVDTDPMGNLIVFKKGVTRGSKTIMFAAHMDEVGIIVTGITDDGYLKFSFVGGVDRRVVIGKRVLIGDKRVPGVIGIKAYHLVSREEEKNVPALDEMYVDIGAASREEAEAMVSLGDTGTFDETVRELGQDLMMAKALDDRLGCAVMMELLSGELPCDCWFVFTTQEEVGCRGALTASFRIQPDIAIILEGTTAADIPGVEEAKQICHVGKGVVVPFMDRGAIYDRAMYELITAIAKENDIPWQTKTTIAGGTDASAIQRSRAGVQTAGIACGLRNIHSPACIGSKTDFMNMLKLTRLVLSKICED